MPKHSRNCIKRQRPAWWTPEGVLAKLQAGEYLLAICQQGVDAMADAGITISIRRLRGEIDEWTETASWGEQLRAARNLWKRTSSGEMALSKHWHDDFLSAMEACDGNAQKAAEMAGIGYGIVLAVMDRRHRCYDPEFTEKFRIAELGRVGRVRERYMDLAETGEGKAAVRAQERIIESALPGLHGQRQEVQVSGKVQHDHEHRHEHLHGLAPGLAREVVTASQNRIRRLNTGRPGYELPAADNGDSDVDGERVIDVTPQRQEVPA